MASRTIFGAPSPHSEGTSKMRVWERISWISSTGERRRTFGSCSRTARSAFLVAQVGTAANRVPGNLRTSCKKIEIPLIGDGLTIVTNPRSKNRSPDKGSLDKVREGDRFKATPSPDILFNVVAHRDDARHLPQQVRFHRIRLEALWPKRQGRLAVSDINDSWTYLQCGC